MGLIVKPGEKPPEPTVDRSSSHAREVAVTRGQAAAIVRNVDKWEQIKSADVPQEVLDYARDRITKGVSPDRIRRELGIARQTSPAWKKIMSALRAGRRIDGPALLEKLAFEYTWLSEKLREQIKGAFEKGVQVATKDGDIVTLHGPTKELNGAIDALNKLNQGFVKLGHDLGAYVDPGDGGGGRGGVTIVVQNNIPRPAKDVVVAHQTRFAKIATGETKDSDEEPKPET